MQSLDLHLFQSLNSRLGVRLHFCYSSSSSKDEGISTVITLQLHLVVAFTCINLIHFCGVHCVAEDLAHSNWMNFFNEHLKSFQKFSSTARILRVCWIYPYSVAGNVLPAFENRLLKNRLDFVHSKWNETGTVKMRVISNDTNFWSFKNILTTVAIHMREKKKK